MAGVACRSCGVILPGRVARCPACGSWAGAWRGLAWWVVMIAGLVGLIVLFQIRRNRVDSGLVADVLAVAGSSTISADGKRIEVSARVENKSDVAVDVVVRFRSKDALGKPASQVDSELSRDLPPGSITTVGASFEISKGPFSTFQGIDVEIVELSPSPEPR